MPNVTAKTKAFKTRQFMAGNSPAVRIPVSMAFEHQSELFVTRVGDRIIVEPQAPSMAELPALLAALAPHFNPERLDVEDQERDWS